MDFSFAEGAAISEWSAYYSIASHCTSIKPFHLLEQLIVIKFGSAGFAVAVREYFFAGGMELPSGQIRLGAAFSHY